MANEVRKMIKQLLDQIPYEKSRNCVKFILTVIKNTADNEQSSQVCSIKAEAIVKGVGL